MSIDRAWICKLGNLPLCRKELEMERIWQAKGWGRSQGMWLSVYHQVSEQNYDKSMSSQFEVGITG